MLPVPPGAIHLLNFFISQKLCSMTSPVRVSKQEQKVSYVGSASYHYNCIHLSLLLALLSFTITHDFTSVYDNISYNCTLHFYLKFSFVSESDNKQQNKENLGTATA